MIKAIVFDLDGTLLDTIEDLADSVNDALRFYGLPELDYPVYKRLVGKGAANLCRTALNTSFMREPSSQDHFVSAEEILAFFKKRYHERMSQKTKPYPGIIAALALLQSHDILLSVLSNKPEPNTKELVAQYFPGIHFQQVIGDGAAFPKKPDPASLLYILDKMGVAPDQTLLIGDGETDMQTAVAANVMPIGVSWGFRTEEELIEAGAKILLKDSSEVNLELLGRICI